MITCCLDWVSIAINLHCINELWEFKINFYSNFVLFGSRKKIWFFPLNYNKKRIRTFKTKCWTMIDDSFKAKLLKMIISVFFVTRFGVHQFNFNLEIFFLPKLVMVFQIVHFTMLLLFIKNCWNICLSFNQQSLLIFFYFF